MMSVATIKYCLVLLAWGLVLISVLSISEWSGDWGHSICGVWGCGPPLQSLLACHGGWLIVLAPAAAAIFAKKSSHVVRRIAAIGLATTAASTLVLAAHEYATWYLGASDWLRPYYFHRVGFTILTTIELPLFELAGISLALFLASLPTRQRAGELASNKPPERLSAEALSNARSTADGDE